MPRIARNGRQGGNTPMTALTDSTGVATFLIPPAQLAVYQGAVPVVSRAVGTVNDRSTAQVSAEPALGTVNTAGLVVKVTVSQAATITTLLLGQGNGLAPAPAGVTVRLFAHGV